MLGRDRRPGTEALRELEGQCGSAAALTFAFVRWVGELNAALACIAFLALVLPFFLHPPPGYSAQAFVGGSLGALLQVPIHCFGGVLLGRVLV